MGFVANRPPQKKGADNLARLMGSGSKSESSASPLGQRRPASGGDTKVHTPFLRTTTNTSGDRTSGPDLLVLHKHTTVSVLLSSTNLHLSRGIRDECRVRSRKPRRRRGRLSRPHPKTSAFGLPARTLRWVDATWEALPCPRSSRFSRRALPAPSSP